MKKIVALLIWAAGVAAAQAQQANVPQKPPSSLTQLPTIDANSGLCNANGLLPKPSGCATPPAGLSIPAPLMTGGLYIQQPASQMAIEAVQHATPSSQSIPGFSFNDLGTNFDFPNSTTHFAFVIDGNSPANGDGSYEALIVTQFCAGRHDGSFCTSAQFNAFGVYHPDPGPFKGSIIGTTLTVTVAPVADVLGVQQMITGAGVTPGTYIKAVGPIVDGHATYTVSSSQTVPSETLTATAWNKGNIGASNPYTYVPLGMKPNSAGGEEIDLELHDRPYRKEFLRFTDLSDANGGASGPIDDIIHMMKAPSAPGSKVAIDINADAWGTDSGFPVRAGGTLMKANTTSLVLDSAIDFKDMAGGYNYAAILLPPNVSGMRFGLNGEGGSINSRTKTNGAALNFAKDIVGFNFGTFPAFSVDNSGVVRSGGDIVIPTNNSYLARNAAGTGNVSVAWVDHSDTIHIGYSASRVQFDAVIVATGVTVVGSLPKCHSGAKGARSFVTDATVTTFLSAVAGGGSNNVPVVCNGSHWVIGAIVAPRNDDLQISKVG